jgi:hypothetical protein
MRLYVAASREVGAAAALLKKAGFQPNSLVT